ncbi:MAG: DUF167 domain-containing protein, partial [Minisyncoccia bacterium]
MKISVVVKTNAKKDLVERLTQPSLGIEPVTEPVVYKVSVCAVPIDGKANRAIIKALATYFDVAPTRVHI